MIAPYTTHIQTEWPQRRTTSLIYPLSLSVSGLMVRCDEFWTWWHKSLILCNIYKDSTPLSFPDCLSSSSFTAEITVLHHAFGWCLQHHSTCPFMYLAVFFANSQSSLSLLNSASNLLAPKCCMGSLVLFCSLSDLAQLSFHRMPGHCDICPNEIAYLLAKISDSIPSSSLPRVCLLAHTCNSLYFSWKQITRLIR